MSPHWAAFFAGALASIALNVAVPSMRFVRGAIASACLTASIITAAWYLP